MKIATSTAIAQPARPERSRGALLKVSDVRPSTSLGTSDSGARSFNSYGQVRNALDTRRVSPIDEVDAAAADRDEQLAAFELDDRQPQARRDHHAFLDRDHPRALIAGQLLLELAPEPEA